MASVALAQAWGVAAGSAQERALRFLHAASAEPPLDPGLDVHLHFHPDRLHDGLPVLARMLADGVYRSQFETGTSNGGLGAHPGGDRWQWESRIFGGAYDGAAPHERPKYGALDIRRRPTGAAPRFGAAYFRLRPQVLRRCSFCYPDSVFGPVDFGVAARMGRVARALAGRRELGDPLDDYVEAHVHGELRLERDVAALVLDACFEGSEIEALARRLPCGLEWHPGFRVDTATLRAQAAYRGQRYAQLACALAQGGVLDARILGMARRSGRYEEQDLKKVWHLVARFGNSCGDPWGGGGGDGRGAGAQESAP